MSTTEEDEIEFFRVAFFYSCDYMYSSDAACTSMVIVITQLTQFK